MDCLSEDDVQAFVEGALTPDMAARAEEHLSECRDCLRVVAEIAESLHESLGEQATVVEEPTGVGAKASAILRPQDRVDRYVIIEPIARGGMGVLYAAQDPRL